MHNTIINNLENVEKENHIKILFACESGSRGWGFASQDSDYDVRFIYIHKPEWYLSVDSKPDVINFFSEDKLLDYNGWDIRKALLHFHSSNPTLFDWLQSPIVYREQYFFKEKLATISEEYYSHRRGIHHYLGIMINTFNEELQKEQVRLKKIFYVLRTALSALWIVRRGTVPPMQFEPLRVLVEDSRMQELIDNLLVQKIQAIESDTVAKQQRINDYVMNIRSECELYSQQLAHNQPPIEKINQLFREMVHTCWN